MYTWPVTSEPANDVTVGVSNKPFAARIHAHAHRLADGIMRLGMLGPYFVRLGDERIFDVLAAR